MQLKVTPILWPLKGMMWTTTEELHSEYYWVIRQLCVCLCICINNVHHFRSKLTNDDFRKLLMTPRAAPSSAPPSKSRHHEWVTDKHSGSQDMFIMMLIWGVQDVPWFPRMPRDYNEDEDPAARRRKKKRWGKSYFRVSTSVSEEE